MVTSTSADSPSRDVLSRAPARGHRLTAILVGAVALAAVLKWAMYVSLGRGLNLFETGTAIVGGIRMLSGQTPYTDFFAFYGPLTYLFPGVAATIAGSVTTADFGWDLIVGVASVVVAYLVAARISRRPVAALLAPLVILLIGAHTARTLPALASILLLTYAESTGRRRWFVLAGGAAGVGLLWIQDGGAWICVAVFITTLLGVGLRGIRPTLGLRTFLLYSAGVASALLPWIVFSVLRGSLGAWIFWTFVFPLTGYTERSATAYFESQVASVFEAGPLRGTYIFVFWVFPFIAVFVIAGINIVGSVVWARRAGGLRSDTIPIASPVAFVVLALYGALQLRVLTASVDEAKLIDSAAPTIVAAVILALAVWSPRRGAHPRMSGTIARVGAGALAVWLILWPIWWQFRTASEAIAGPRPESTHLIGGLPFTSAAPPTTTPAGLDELVHQVTMRTGSEDGILVLPTSPLIYAATDRSNPSRYDYLDPVYTTSQVDADIAAVLRSGAVALVVLGHNDFPGSRSSGADIAPETYAVIDDLFTEATTVEGFTVLVPRS